MLQDWEESVAIVAIYQSCFVVFLFFNFQGIEILRFILDLFIYCLIPLYFSWGKGIH